MELQHIRLLAILFGLLAYIPLLEGIFRTKSMTGVFFTWMFFELTAQSLWFFYGTKEQKKSIIIPSIIGIIFVMTLIALKVIYA